MSYIVCCRPNWESYGQYILNKTGNTFYVYLGDEKEEDIAIFPTEIEAKLALKFYPSKQEDWEYWVSRYIT